MTTENDPSSATTHELVCGERSGTDLDIWGGERTHMLLVPGPGTVCVLHDEEGSCLIGCDACEKFLREMSSPQRTQIQNHEGYDEREK